jgi:hypothetical protein
VPILQVPRQRAEPLGRPALVGPGRARVEQCVPAARVRGHLPRDIGGGNRQRKFRFARLDAQRREKSQIESDDVGGLAGRAHAGALGIVVVRVEPRRRALPGLPRREADDARCAGESGERRGFEEALQIDRDVVAAAAQTADRRRDRETSARAAIVHDDPIVDDGHEIENCPVLRAHEPVDAGVGMRAAQRGGDGNRVHHVAQGAEADYQESHVARLTSQVV